MNYNELYDVNMTINWLLHKFNILIKNLNKI